MIFTNNGLFLGA